MDVRHIFRHIQEFSPQKSAWSGFYFEGVNNTTEELCNKKVDGYRAPCVIPKHYKYRRLEL